MEKKILDATCGSRMIWFNKENPLALYVDRRELEDEAIWKSGNGLSTRYLTIKPDLIADFTHLPFEDNCFYHVVFDPPHLLHISDNAWMCKKYGRLAADWKPIIRKGFDECYRVLKPNGTLVFKWNDFDISVREIINVIGKEPLYGNRSGRRGKTHWMVFFKEASDEVNICPD